MRFSTQAWDSWLSKERHAYSKRKEPENHTVFNCISCKAECKFDQGYIFDNVKQKWVKP